MNINRSLGDILYNLQQCVRCNGNQLQCRVCSYKALKLDYKYFENI